MVMIIAKAEKIVRIIKPETSVIFLPSFLVRGRVPGLNKTLRQMRLVRALLDSLEKQLSFATSVSYLSLDPLVPVGHK